MTPLKNKRDSLLNRIIFVRRTVVFLLTEFIWRLSLKGWKLSSAWNLSRSRLDSSYQGTLVRLRRADLCSIYLVFRWPDGLYITNWTVYSQSLSVGESKWHISILWSINRWYVAILDWVLDLLSFKLPICAIIWIKNYRNLHPGWPWKNFTKGKKVRKPEDLNPRTLST